MPSKGSAVNGRPSLAAHSQVSGTLGSASMLTATPVAEPVLAITM